MTEPTQEFKHWFGDSKILGADGSPLMVYHGTSADIAEFIEGDDGGNYADLSVPHEGIWFASEPERAEWYAHRSANIRGGSANIVPCYLAMKNPYVYPAQKFADDGISGMEDIYYIKRDGYDGVIAERAKYNDSEEVVITGYDYVVFSHDQIRFALAVKPEVVRLKDACPNNSVVVTDASQEGTGALEM